MRLAFNENMIQFNKHITDMDVYDNMLIKKHS